MSDETPNPTQAAPPPQPTGPAQRRQVTIETPVNTSDLSVAGRLKSQFAPAYLTLANIIQGVALMASRMGACETLRQRGETA